MCMCFHLPLASELMSALRLDCCMCITLALFGDTCSSIHSPIISVLAWQVHNLFGISLCYGMYQKLIKVDKVRKQGTESKFGDKFDQKGEQRQHRETQELHHVRHFERQNKQVNLQLLAPHFSVYLYIHMQTC